MLPTRRVLRPVPDHPGNGHGQGHRRPATSLGRPPAISGPPVPNATHIVVHRDVDNCALRRLPQSGLIRASSPDPASPHRRPGRDQLPGFPQNEPQLWVNRWTTPASLPGPMCTAVHSAVDNCGRRASGCGRRPPDRWTACGGKLVTHSACDFPTASPPGRPHPIWASDLRRHRLSTVCTAPTTTTTHLSDGEIHTPSSGSDARPAQSRTAPRRRSACLVPPPPSLA